MLEYDFGPGHPLKPERLRRAIVLLGRYGFESPVDPGPGDPRDALRVHSEEFVEAVRRLSADSGALGWEMARYGFGAGDNPPFCGMYEASLAYVAGTVEAAKAVRDGEKLAFNLSGGLHHARRAEASGFCVFNDPAIAVHILLEKFERVAYVDIDVHHGDGVQWLWYDDPRVLTCSIHQDGRTLYPGTGFVEETGEAFTSVNVPLWPGTTGDVWLWAFEEGVLPFLAAFEPQAIVLQMGTDAHFLDPLAHLQVSAQEWLRAVDLVKAVGAPIVAVGGGGYNLTTVPRMWAAATLTLAGIAFEDEIPADLAERWEMPRFFDAALPGPRGIGKEHAEQAVGRLREHLLPNLTSK